MPSVCLVKAIWIDGEKLPFCDEGCKVPAAVGGCSTDAAHCWLLEGRGRLWHITARSSDSNFPGAV